MNEYNTTKSCLLNNTTKSCLNVSTLARVILSKDEKARGPIKELKHFCLFDNPEHVNCFLEYINGFHPNINFIVEEENDKTLPFLDVSIFKDYSEFSTSLYRKKTFTGLYTDFSSLSPKKYKTNLVSVLVYRAFHICSTYENFHKELCKIKAILYENCFPKSLIDSVLRVFLDKQFNKKVSHSDEKEDKQRILFFLPFLGQYSLRIKHNIDKLIRQCYPNVKLQFVFRSPRRLCDLFASKDRLLSLVRSNVVYKFTCSCCSATYYGKTSRNPLIRRREHLGINKLGQNIKSSGPSSIKDHICKTGHIATFEDFSILAKIDNAFDLLIYESLLIFRDRPSLNSQQSSIPLALF